MLLYFRVFSKTSELYTPPESDPYGNDVSLLLAADNFGSTFVDSSVYNAAVTSHFTGQGFLGPFNSTGAANFDGTDGYLSVEGESAALSGGDFTLDVWFKSTDLTGNHNIIWLNGESEVSGYCAINLLTVGDKLGIRCSYENTDWNVSNLDLGTISTNAWHYYSVQLTNNIISVFLDGLNVADIFLSQPLMQGTVNLVGAGTEASRDFLNGNLSELRLTKGIARYVADYTPPTAPSGNSTSTALSTDLHADKVSFLLHCNNINGTDSIIDTCGNVPKLVKSTVNGEYPKLTNFTSKFGGTSLSFNGGQSVVFPSVPEYGIAGDFTLEFFARFNTLSGISTIFQIGQYSNGLAVRVSSNNGVDVVINNVNRGTGAMPSTYTLSLHTWHHFAIVRTGSALEVYVNGIRRSKNITASGIIPAKAITIGASVTTQTEMLNGYLDELRLTNGVARYSANFTPPTAPLSSTVETSALLSGTALADSSANAFPLVSRVAVQDSPFSDGSFSGYFNGVTDYLSVATNSAFTYGTGNFTLEAWIKPTSPIWNTGTFYILDHGSSVGYLAYIAGVVRFVGTSTHSSTQTGHIVSNTWTHIAVSRTSGVLRIYINGTPITLTTTASTWNPTTTLPLWVGRSGASASYYEGYISNLRITKGEALYSGTTPFTVPSAPLTLGANTQFLTCNGTSIVDASTNALTIATLTTVPAVSTALTPFTDVGGSITFNGTSDKLTIPASSKFSLGTADFTIEFWMRLGVLGVMRGVIGNTLTATQNLTTWNVAIQANNKLKFLGYSTSIHDSTTVFALNTWYHISYQRINGFLHLFVNGVMDTNPVACYNDFSTVNGVQIGWNNSGYFNGNLSNIRVTKGLGVYDTTYIKTPTSINPNVGFLATATQKDAYSANTSLLIDGESLTKDALKTTNLTVSGSVSLSASIKKSGNSSLSFNGGVINLAGNSQYSFGIADFTLEAYINIKNLSNNKQVLIDFRNSLGSTDSYFAIYNSTGADGNSNCFSWYADGVHHNTTGYTPEARQWYHIAVTRTANVLRIFINGTLRYSGIDLAKYAQGTSGVILGGSLSGDSFAGYVDSLRLTRVASRYTANFVPPLSIPDGTVDEYESKCVLNLSGDGAQGSFTFTDSSRNVLVPTVTGGGTNIYVSNSIYRQGTGSIYGTGAGYLTYSAASTESFGFGTDDFTIEGYIYRTASSPISIILNKGNGINGGFQLWVNTNNIVYLKQNNVDLNLIGTVQLNTWTHFALTRTNSTLQFFINGIRTYQELNTYNFTDVSSNVLIGKDATTNYLNCYLDTLKVYKGVAKYTSEFSILMSPKASLVSGQNLQLATWANYRAQVSLIWDPVSGISNNKFVVSTSTSIKPNALTASTLYGNDSKAANLSVTALSLKGDTQYYITPIATLPIGGDSILGETIAIYMGPVVAPRNLSITAILNDPTSFKVNFTPAINAGSHTLYWSTSPGVNTSSVNKLPVINGSLSAINTLYSNTKYYFTLVAEGGSSSGTSAACAEVEFVTAVAPAAVPAQVLELTVSSPNMATFKFNWTPSTTASRYRIYGSRTVIPGGVGPITGNEFFSADIIGQDTSEYIWKDWDVFTETTALKYFSIVAENATGQSVVSSQVQLGLAARGTVAGLNSPIKYPHKLKLAWTAFTSATGYMVFGSKVTGFNDTNPEASFQVEGNANTSLWVDIDTGSQTWYWRVAAIFNNNPASYSTLSGQVTAATTADTAPAISVSTNGYNNKMTVSFALTADTTDTYDISYANNPDIDGTGTTVYTTTASTVISGLTAGTTYYVRLNVTRNNGTYRSASSAVKTVLIGATAVPGTPSITPYVTTAKVTWTAPNLTGVYDHIYRIYRASSAENAAAGIWDGTVETHALSHWGGAGSGFFTIPTSFYITGLVANTSYWLKVTCVRIDEDTNRYGNDLLSAVGTFTTKADTLPISPNIDSIVKSVVNPRTTVTLNWTAVPGVTSYTVHRGAFPDFNDDFAEGYEPVPTNRIVAPGTAMVSSNNVGAVTTATITNCKPGVLNCFKIQANSAAGTSDVGDYTLVTMDAAPAMETPVASFAADRFNSMTLNWTAYANEGTALGYRIFYAPASANLPSLYSLGWSTTHYAVPKLLVGAVTTATVTGLESGTTYNVIICPYNALGFLGTSEVVTFTTDVPAAPTGVTWTAVADAVTGLFTSATLAWDTVSGAQQYNVWIKESDTITWADTTVSNELNLTKSFTGLIAGHTYYVGVAVKRASGWSNIGKPSGSITIPLMFPPYMGNATLIADANPATRNSIRLDGDAPNKSLVVPPSEGFEFENKSFTIEGWFKADAVDVEQDIISKAPLNRSYNLWRIHASANGDLKFSSSSDGNSYDVASGTVFGNISANQWHHFAIVRSVNTFYCFLNGVLGAEFNSSANYTKFYGPVHVGSNLLSNDNFNGFVEGIRITKGVARYTSNFTAEDAKSKFVTDAYWQATSLLLHGHKSSEPTNVVDSSRLANTCSALNGAVISNFKSKFDNHSVKLPTSSSAISLAPSSDFAFGTGDFTIEAWINPLSVTSEFNVFATDGASPNFRFFMGTSTATNGTLSFWNGAANQAIGGLIALNEWTHIAFVRAKGSLSVYVNGAVFGPVAYATNLASTQNIKIGAASGFTNGTGYISDLRVTKAARYTAAFTIPSSSYVDFNSDYDLYQNQTSVLLHSESLPSISIKDYAGKSLVCATSLAVNPINANPKNTCRVTWPEYPWATNYGLYYSKFPNVGLGEIGTTRLWIDSRNTNDVAGLVANTKYYWRLSAFVDGQETQLSDPTIEYTTQLIPKPITPSITYVPTNKKTAMRINWSAYPDASAAVTGYNVYWSLTSDVGIGVAGTTKITKTASVFTADVTGLTINTNYYVKVTAVTKWGESELSDIATITTEPLFIPQNLEATVSQGNPSFGATLSIDNHVDATGYKVYYSLTPGVTKSSSSVVATSIVKGSTRTTFEATGLTHLSTYYFKVAAVSSSPVWESDLNAVEVSMTTLTPPQVSGLTVDYVTLDRVTSAQFSMNNMNLTSKATVYYSADPAIETMDLVALKDFVANKSNSGTIRSNTITSANWVKGATLTTFSISGLTEDTKYYFRVTASSVTPAWESMPSVEMVSLTTDSASAVTMPTGLPTLMSDFNNPGTYDQTYWVGWKSLAGITNETGFWEGRNGLLEAILFYYAGLPVDTRLASITNKDHWLFEIYKQAKANNLTLVGITWKQFKKWCRTNLVGISDLNIMNIWFSVHYKTPTVIKDNMYYYLNRTNLPDGMVNPTILSKFHLFTTWWIDFYEQSDNEGVMGTTYGLQDGTSWIVMQRLLDNQRFEFKTQDYYFTQDCVTTTDIAYYITFNGNYAPYIAYATDATLRATYGADYMVGLENLTTLVHEYGHALDQYREQVSHPTGGGLGEAYTQLIGDGSWAALFDWPDTTKVCNKRIAGPKNPANNLEYPVSAYGCFTLSECFAEAHAMYCCNPTLMAAMWPKQYAFLNNLINNSVTEVPVIY